MRLEIISAADFLVQLLRLQAGQLSETQLQMFKHSIQEVLRRRYTDHWFPDKPNRGSGYRCIRINGKMDPVIAQAGVNVGLGPTMLHQLFPSELTMWIDPAEVSYRIGENGSICVLFEGRPGQEELQSGSSASSSGSESLDEQMVEQQQQHHHHHPQQYHPQQQFLQAHHHHHQHHFHVAQQQQQFESCKDSLLLEHTQFSEQIAAFVSS